MTEENLKQYSEDMQMLRDEIRNLAGIMSSSMSEEQRHQLKLQKNQQEVDDLTDAFDDLNPEVRAAAAYYADQKRQLENFKNALEKGAESAKKAFESLTNQTDRTFGKYSGAIQDLTDGLSGFAGKFAPFVKAIGTVTTAFIEQQDRLLKASDELAKYGVAQAMTTSQLRDMAHQAGVTTKNLDILIKPIQSMGPGLRNLGLTAGDGAKEFAKLTAVTGEQRKEFSRLGVSQQELIQRQSDYVSLQSLSGQQITREMMVTGKLQKQSLDYAENLQTLAALSGKDIDTIKKEQQLALSREETMIQSNLMDQEILRLKKSTRSEDQERAKQLEKERDARNKLLVGIQTQIGDEKLSEGMAKFLATGAVTQESAALKRMGVPIEEFAQRIKKGEDVTGDFLNAVAKAGDETMKQVGPAAMFNKETREAFLINQKMMQFFAKTRGQDQVEAIKKAEKEVEETRKKGTDAAKDARASLTELEIKAGKALDYLTGSATGAALAIGALGLGSMLKSGVATNITEALKNLGKGAIGKVGGPIASTVATAATGATGTAGAAGAAGAGAAGAAGAGAAGAAGAGAAGAAGAAKRALGVLGRLAAPLTAVVGIVDGISTAAQGISEANKELKEGKITEKEAKIKKTEAKAEGTGVATGTLIGTGIGFLVGGPLGAAAGAAIGNYLGGKGGKAIGTMIGESASDEIKDTNKEEKLVSKKDDITKVSLVNPLPVPVSIVKGLEALGKLTKPMESIGGLDALLSRPRESQKEITNAGNLVPNEEFKKILAQFGPAALVSKDIAKQVGLMTTGLKQSISEKEPGVIKKNLDLPKASEGGSFEGPESGYPVLLHGKEDVIPREETKKIQSDNIFGSLNKILTSAPTQLGSKASESMDSELLGKAINYATSKAIDKVVPQIIRTGLNVGEKVENLSGQNTDTITAITEIGKMLPTIGPILNKVESVSKIISKDSSPIEKLIEVSKLLNPTVRLLVTLYDVAKPMLQEANKKPSEIKTDVAQVEVAESIPKAARGGIFEGPKSGYNVELHGKEKVVPIDSGVKVADLSYDEDNKEEELKLEELQLKSLKDSENALKKFTDTVVKLNELNQEDLELIEKEKEVQSTFANSIKGATLDLSNFASKIKFALSKTSVSSDTTQTPDQQPTPVVSSSGAPVLSGSGGPVMSGMPAVSSTPPPVKQDVKQNLGDIKSALMKRGMTDEKYLNAVLGNVMKESQGKVVNENLDYSKTSNERIRSIFGSRVAGKSDEEINKLKATPESFGESMYGSTTAIGRRMGNTEPGDGWKFRGRGYIQLTGKSNYAAASKAIFGDERLVKDPDLVNDPKVAAEVAAWYMQRGKTQMAKKMGIDESSMTQEQANLLATSQIAGVDVRKSGGYLGGEIMQKVASYAGSKEIQGIQASSEATQVAKLDKEKIPKAQTGGVFSGPDTGYFVQLHGDETVVPSDKLLQVRKQELGIDIGPGNINDTASSITDSLSDKFKQLSSGNENMVKDAIVSMKDELKTSLHQMAKQIIEERQTTTVASNEEILLKIAASMSQLVETASESTNIQGKLLQYSQT